jgi:5S rRNA maturation endonuclease (ribonuclease M5)/ribosomal protein L37AE/L43A
MKLVQDQGWKWKRVDSNRIELELCPFCNKTGYGHFYVELAHGLWICHHCSKDGNLYDLQRELGIKPEPKREKTEHKTMDSLPDVDKCHEALLQDADALDYLMNGRGFSLDIIKRQKLGVTTHYFRDAGETRALVFPYLVHGNCIWAKLRTLPTMPLEENRVPKAFHNPSGYDTMLYNGEILKEGLTELTLCEGECDALAAMDHGIEDICAVPGANIKKAEWINTIDKLGIEKVFICYDRDKVGQKAARILADRIGVEKCYAVILPDFEGKDLNDWFLSGGTKEQFQELKAKAQLFDIEGVASASDAVEELQGELAGKGGIEPKYKTSWHSLNKYVGFNPGDIIDLIGVEKAGKSTVGLNIMEHMVDTYGEDAIIICLEMTRSSMARKFICMKAQIADNIPQDAAEASRLLAEFTEAIPRVQAMVASRPGQLYFCYPKYKTVDDIYQLMTNCIRRYGVKWIMLDNLQRLCDTTIGSKNRTQHLSEISKVTSQIAKDYNIQLLRILQPHRIANGQMVTTDSVDGSSQVAKDCDCMITIHRDKVDGGSLEEFQAVGFVEGPGSFSNKMKVTVGLSRYSGGGYTTLEYDGARSTVREFNTTQLHQFDKLANKNVGYANQLKAFNIQIKEPEDIRP